MILRKNALVAGGTLVGLFLVALSVLPLFLRGRIEARAHAEIERALDAQVAWSGVSLTFFRDFPNLTMALDDLTVVGNGDFAGDTLVSMKGFRLVLDVGTVVRALRGTGPVLVRSVQLDAPSLRLSVLDGGSASWDIARPGTAENEPPAPSGRGVTIELQSLAVTDGRLLLEDPRTGLYVSMAGLQHSLSGDFSQDRFVVRTLTRADATTVRFAGLPYLEGVALDFRADLDADMVGRRFAFADNQLRLNDLLLEFAGSAVRSADGVALDMTFHAPRTEFAQILSLVPMVYAHDFEELETSGTFSLEGRVQGDWGDRAFPSFALTAEVADGMFRYPDLPLPARDVSLHLAMNNPGGDVDSTVVRLERFHLVLGDQPVDAALTLRTPASDPDIDLVVKGTVNLADVARTVKFADVEELSGTVRADAAVRARMSDVDAARWDRVGARGTVAATDVALRSAAFPHPIAVREATLELSPQRADVQSLQMQLGSSDVRAAGSLDNVLGFALRREALRGRATFHSENFNLDEWKSDSALQLIPVPAGVDLALDGTVDRLTYGALDMADARGTLLVKDQRVTLEELTLETLGGHVGVTGFYETTDPVRPTFGVGLALDSLDIPGASAALLTVRSLAPVARFARGAFTAQLTLDGALGSGMEPVFGALNGGGSLQTTSLVLEGFPAMARLADALSLPQLTNPTLSALRSTIDIHDGRLHVRPFQVRMGEFRLSVSGSNGVDQSLDYTLALAVPRTLLGGAADQAFRTLLADAGRAGLELQATDSLEVSVAVRGLVTAPTVETAFGRAITTVGDQARQAVAGAVTQRLDATEARVDSTAEENLRRAQARADSIIQAAEARATAVRTEARMLADTLRAEANRGADKLVAEATNPVARVAARAAADRLRKEADAKAEAMVQEADRRAEAMVAEARVRAGAIVQRDTTPP
ncbi:MAG TPA: AsmA-like C-terminal region-containing protein [Longimicrobiales bacterium]|nr:AsmA-like C-terminal region-containing protein [Longimicrobiales bacterium]